MKGIMTITCTEERTEDGISTETSIRTSIQTRARADRYSLMLNIADSLEFTSEDWMALDVYRLFVRTGMLPNGKATAGTHTTMDIGAIERAIDAMRGSHDEI